MSRFSPAAFFDPKGLIFADELFAGCEHVWDLIPKISQFLAGQKLGTCAVKVPDGAFIIKPELVLIMPGVVIEPGAYIEGPCIIGEESVIRHGAYIRGNVITGKRVVIGHATEVKNALFFDDAKAAHFAYVGDSVLGSEVNLGAGVKLANLKLNRGSISLYHDGERVNTGLKKFGACLGDGAQLGCNAVANPGTLFGRGASCYPCVTVSGFVPEGAVIKHTHS